MNTNNEVIKKKRGRPTGTISYEAYSREYDNLAFSMKKRGYTMGEEKYNKTTWLRMYAAVKNDRTLEIKKGKRKTLGNINRDIIRRQQWKFTSAQAKAQIKVYQSKGRKRKI